MAAVVPHDRILIETDCPYLAPHPYRGHINNSSYMVYTAKTLSEILGLDFDTTVVLTANNAKKLFGI